MADRTTGWGIGEGRCSRRRWTRLVSWFGLLAASAAAVGCAVRQPSPVAAGQDLFTGDLQEIAPYHDGDEWVRRVSGGTPLDGVLIERISELAPDGTFTSVTTRDGKALSRMHLRSDGTSVALESDEIELVGMRFVYDPPLPVVGVPLRTGELKFEGRVHLFRMDGKPIADGSVESTRILAPAAPESQADFTLQQEIRMQMGPQRMVDRTTSWLRRGVGSVHTESVLNGKPTRSDLVCATIAGRKTGACESGSTQ